MKFYASLLLVMLFVSCSLEQMNKNKKAKEEEIASIAIDNLVSVENEASRIYWSANIPDTANYECRILFKRDIVEYWLHGQCVLIFPIIVEGTNVKVLWDFEEDCLLDLDVIKGRCDHFQEPKSGEVFAELSQYGDTINVKHQHVNWINCVNNKSNMLMFPKYFIREE